VTAILSTVAQWITALGILMLVWIEGSR